MCRGPLSLKPKFLISLVLDSAESNLYYSDDLSILHPKQG